MKIQNEIKKLVNLNDYSSFEIGQYVETTFGDFICIGKPNIYQPIDTRFWAFEQTTDSDGEPVMDGQIVKIFH